MTNLRRRHRLKTSSWLYLALFGGTVSLLALLSQGRSTSAASAPWGVDRLRIVRTAGGHLLDFRYRVVDPRRAAGLLARRSRAEVVDGKTGVHLPVPTTPKAGPLRNTGRPRVGRTYFALFSNPGGIVRRGDRVAVSLGDLHTSLIVE